MKKITLAIFILGFFLFRPYQLQNSGMLYKGDDVSYLAHSTAIAFYQFPNYSKEVFDYEALIPPHPLGPQMT